MGVTNYLLTGMILQARVHEIEILDDQKTSSPNLWQDRQFGWSPICFAVLRHLDFWRKWSWSNLDLFSNGDSYGFETMGFITIFHHLGNIFSCPTTQQANLGGEISQLFDDIIFFFRWVDNWESTHLGMTWGICFKWAMEKKHLGDLRGWNFLPS